jgi:hypothetical protein
MEDEEEEELLVVIICRSVPSSGQNHIVAGYYISGREVVISTCFCVALGVGYAQAGAPLPRCSFPRSRFQLNVTAGSQKRAIANLRKSKGRDESRFALKLKRNLDFNCKSRLLSIFCHYWDKHCLYWDRRFVWAFSRCVENDPGDINANHQTSL